MNYGVNLEVKQYEIGLRGLILQYEGKILYFLDLQRNIIKTIRSALTDDFACKIGVLRLKKELNLYCTYLQFYQKFGVAHPPIILPIPIHLFLFVLFRCLAQDAQRANSDQYTF